MRQVATPEKHRVAKSRAQYLFVAFHDERGLGRDGVANYYEAISELAALKNGKIPLIFLHRGDDDLARHLQKLSLKAAQQRGRMLCDRYDFV